MSDFDCCDHAEQFKFHKHPDHGKKVTGHLADHERAAGAPGHHTDGSMPSQLNPDHGPHHHKRR